MKEIIASIPVVLEDDPVAEVAREQVIQSLRVKIAKRWKRILAIKSLLPLPDWTRIIDEMVACVAALVEECGNEIPFAPDMRDIISMPTTEKESTPVCDKDSPGSSKASSTGSTRTCIPHEFRWLQLDEGVWTALKARGFEKVWGFNKTRSIIVTIIS